MASENIVTIPQDIITDILHRLPAKSLGQFRRVSKNWLSLLSQPKFIKTHRNIFKRNHLIFISLDYALYSVPVDNHEAVSRPIKLDISAYYGSCNGLVFMSTCCGTLIILNPTTKEFVEFPGHMMINDGDVDTMMSDDCKLVSVGEKLAIYIEITGEIWLMNEYGVNESWTKILVHGLNEIPLIEPVIYYDNGKIIILEVRGDISQVSNRQTKVTAKPKAEQHKYGDEREQIRQVQSTESHKYGDDPEQIRQQQTDRFNRQTDSADRQQQIQQRGPNNGRRKADTDSADVGILETSKPFTTSMQ
ncbi:F-box associated domain containing protein [Tanacetum coccineum]